VAGPPLVVPLPSSSPPPSSSSSSSSSLTVVEEERVVYDHLVELLPSFVTTYPHDRDIDTFRMVAKEMGRRRPW